MREMRSYFAILFARSMLGRAKHMAGKRAGHVPPDPEDPLGLGRVYKSTRTTAKRK